MSEAVLLELVGVAKALVIVGGITLFLLMIWKIAKSCRW